MAMERAVMPADLFRAAIKGNNEVLTQRLRLLPEELQEIKVTIEASHSAPEEINTENQTVQSELQSATCSGDTILHLLITKGHNELAFKVFQRDMSLLKARNNMLETPLYCAAKVGNKEVIYNLIQSDRAVVKDALGERNKNEDTALHIAAKHGHRDIGRLLMNLDQEIAHKVNDKMVSPLRMAIMEGHDLMVETMLEVDPTLACTPFSDGMFPVHEAASKGYLNMVKHFIEEYPDDAELQDPCGRNLFHIAAEENHEGIFSCAFKLDASFSEMIVRMNIAKNYEGNTPFHIAAMKGHRNIMRAIWKHCQVAETVENTLGYRPFELSIQEVQITNKDNNMIGQYLKTGGNKFTPKWFAEVMEPPLKNKWERTQVIGLGSVLITTVTFAASFTMPGGYNQDNGTPVLGRRYMFRAFILANGLAFMLGFLSLSTLLKETLGGLSDRALVFATLLFMCAASSMVVAFGLGLYVTLAPVCLPIAILALVSSLFFGSPGWIVAIDHGKSIVTGPIMNYSYYILLACYAIQSFLFIFCLAFM